MKHFFVITLLVAILCKVVEPCFFAWQFDMATDAENVSVYDEQLREIKIYQPIPYHSVEKQNVHISETYQEGDKFYNIVEQRYANDTFYVKIQDNLSAREQFFALGDAVKEINLDKTQNTDNQPIKSIITLEDLSKVFSPSHAPALVSESWFYIESPYQLYSNYLLFIPSFSLAVPTPPPNC